MKFIVDMNLSPRWVELLKSESIPAVHWAALGQADALDDAIVRHAKAHGFAVLTSDLDFGIYLALTRDSRPSVVQIRSRDLEPNLIGLRVLLALRNFASEIDDSALVTVDLRRIRLRMLPFGDFS